MVVGPHVLDDLQVHPKEGPVLAHSHPYIVDLVPGMGPDKSLGARFDPLDRPAQPPGHCGGDEVFRNQPLPAKGPPDIAGEDTYTVIGQVEHAGNDATQPIRDLVGGPDGQVLPPGVP